MLTDAEIWIAVVFCVWCKGLTTVECEDPNCVVSFNCRQTHDKKHDKCVVYLHVVSHIRLMWQILSSLFVGSVSLLKNKWYFAQKMHGLKSKEIAVLIYWKEKEKSLI